MINHINPYSEIPYNNGFRTYYEYPNLNKNKELRKKVTQFFYKKLKNKLNNNNLKNKLNLKFVYKYVRKYIKKKNINWWDSYKKPDKIIKYLMKKLLI